MTDRRSAVRRATSLNRLTLAYNLAEAAVALAVGALAGSLSLVGFGLDSVIEVSASLILGWRLAQERRAGCTQEADQRATRAVAFSFATLAAYLTVESVRRLVTGDAPHVTVIGMVLAATSLAVMPALARAKRQLAPVLGSRAQRAEADQTSLCAAMSGIVLVGLVANAVAGWWWADACAALAIGLLAGSEAIKTWRADSLEDTCCAP